MCELWGTLQSMSVCILPAQSDEGVLQGGYRNNPCNTCKQEQTETTKTLSVSRVTIQRRQIAATTDHGEQRSQPRAQAPHHGCCDSTCSWGSDHQLRDRSQNLLREHCHPSLNRRDTNWHGSLLALKNLCHQSIRPS